MLRTGEVNHPPAAMVEDKKDVEEAEIDRRDGAKVDGPGNSEMIAREGKPHCGLGTRGPRLDHVIFTSAHRFRFTLLSEHARARERMRDARRCLGLAFRCQKATSLKRKKE